MNIIAVIQNNYELTDDEKYALSWYGESNDINLISTLYFSHNFEDVVLSYFENFSYLLKPDTKLVFFSKNMIDLYKYDNLEYWYELNFSFDNFLNHLSTFGIIEVIIQGDNETVNIPIVKSVD